MTTTLWAILGYVVLQVLFGVWVSRKVHTEQDYLVAGRNLGPYLATATVFATWFGAETCIGAAGQAYSGGLAETTADPFGYALCLLVMGAVFAVPLWKAKMTTLADLFRRHYGPWVERVAALLMVPTSVLWAGAQIRAFGQVLGATSEWGLALAITLAAAVVIAYTALGGLLADAMSDGVQGLVLILGLVAVLVAFIASGDGIHLQALLVREPERLHLVRLGQDGFWATAECWAVPVLGSVVAQELVARVAAARTGAIAKGSALVAGSLYLVVGLVPIVLGLAAVPVLADLQHPEQVLAHMAEHYLSTPLYVVFVGALVSAILSTVDSALLVAGSLLAHNLILPNLPKATAATRLRVNRVAVVGFGLAAYALALSAPGVYELVEEASALGTSGVFVCVVFALFTRFGGTYSALVALLLGLVVYGVGSQGLLAHPYLASLAAALAGYCGVALCWERRRQLAA